jgi:putative adhesin
MIRHKLQFGAALALALAAATGITAAAAADTHEQSFPLKAGGLLRIDTDRGHIEIRHSSGRDATITVSVDSGKITDLLDVTMEQTPEGVVVRGRKAGKGSGSEGWLSGWLSGWSSSEIRFVAQVPDGVDLDLKTAGGHITLGDVGGKVRAVTSGGHIRGGRLERGGTLDTAGGHIEISGAGADLQARTSGGHIRLGVIDGNVRAETSGGHIEVDGCSGDAELHTAGGHIKVAKMEGRVQAHTAGGNISLAMSGTKARGADLETAGGSIEVEVPPGAGFQLDAQADGGTVDADLPAFESTGGARSSERLEGTIGGGGSPLRLRTSHGTIRIRQSGSV